MSTDNLARLADEAGIQGPDEIVPRLAHRAELIYRAVERFVSLAESTDNLSEMVGDTISRDLIPHLIANYNVRADRSSTGVKRNILSSQATAALQAYIEAHLPEAIKRDDHSAIAGQTVHNLLVGFCQRFATTPARYIIRQRLRRSRWQLSRTAKSISAIAYEVGFSSQSHLTGAFKKHCGIAPRAFRNSSRS